MNQLNFDEQAKCILIDNDRDGYTVPSKHLYPYQWNWDSAFSALGWFLLDWKRAFREIELLLSAQWKNGMVPHIIFHKNDPNYFPGPHVWKTNQKIPTSGYSQPPVLASLLKKMIEPDPTTREMLQRTRALIPSLMAWHRWFWKERNPEGKGLICILHPWESGRDNLPDWDIGMKTIDTSAVGGFSRKDTNYVDSDCRPLQDDYKKYLALLKIGIDCNWDSSKMMKRQSFLMIDVFMTTVLLRANRDLLDMTKHFKMSKEITKIEQWIEITEKHFDFLWNPEVEAFCTYDLIRKKHVEHISSANFMALYAQVVDSQKAQILCKTFDRWASQVKFTVPSFNPNSQYFEDKRYWRGPTWLQMNYLLKQGFLDYDMLPQAQRIIDDSKTLIHQSSFSEYYSPVTGNPLGGELFSWTAAVWLADFSH